MISFDFNARLAALHQRFPAADRRPVVGITGNYGEQTCKLGEGYYKQIVRAGGTPLIIPPLADEATILETNCSLPDWPSTDNYPYWASAEAYRPSSWH